MRLNGLTNRGTLHNSIEPKTRVLITGATGYVGGRLVRALECDSRIVLRCMARHPEHIAPRILGKTEVFRGDLSDSSSLPPIFDTIDVAFFLVHSLAQKRRFEAQEEITAQNFAEAAKVSKTKRIIFLGGLGKEPGLSQHLRSRHRVGEILRSSGIPTLEFRAGVIIGSGSVSFEIIRTLVQRLPVMTVPRWGKLKTQPIGIDDVVSYLTSALFFPDFGRSIVEIGGPDQVSYIDMLRLMAQIQKRRRLIVPVPVLTPWLSSLWLGLVTPFHARIGRKLIESLINETIVSSDLAKQLFPHIKPIGIRQAFEIALTREGMNQAQTR